MRERERERERERGRERESYYLFITNNNVGTGNDNNNNNNNNNKCYVYIVYIYIYIYIYITGRKTDKFFCYMGCSNSEGLSAERQNEKKKTLVSQRNLWYQQETTVTQVSKVPQWKGKVLLSWCVCDIQRSHDKKGNGSRLINKVKQWLCCLVLRWITIS